LPRIKSKTQGAYKVQVKSRGKWVSISKDAFDYESASAYGQDAVDNSSEKSYRVTKAPKKAKIRNYSGSGNDFKFRAKKGVKIEMNEFGIDTPGEVRKISAKGWASNERKAAKKRFWSSLF
jgi:hypothetical protein